MTAINQATKRVWLTTPYFVPDESLLTALVTAALRGVDVRLLVPRRGDSLLVDLAARSYFPELLEGRVRVHEYQPRFIHAKTMLCDDDVAIVGTANFDNRSFRLDFELAAVLFGLSQASRQSLDLVAVYGGSRLTAIRKISLPGALPSIFAAARVSVPGAVTGALLAEWLSTGKGIGGNIQKLPAAARFDDLWAAVAIITVVTLVLYNLVQLLESVALERMGMTSR